jgi:CheY-like chemotaxis protein
MTKVLVVDDYRAMGEFLTDVFAAQGWQVAYVRNGSEALPILEQEAGWLILLDLHMPEMDGFALLRAIQTTPSYASRNVVVVMTAQQLSPGEQETLTTAGVKAILFKPFDLDDLLQAVQTWAPPPLSEG